MLQEEEEGNVCHDKAEQHCRKAFFVDRLDLVLQLSPRTMKHYGPVLVDRLPHDDGADDGNADQDVEDSLLDPSNAMIQAEYMMFSSSRYSHAASTG